MKQVGNNGDMPQIAATAAGASGSKLEQSDSFSAAARAATAAAMAFVKNPTKENWQARESASAMLKAAQKELDMAAPKKIEACGDAQKVGVGKPSAKVESAPGLKKEDGRVGSLVQGASEPAREQKVNLSIAPKDLSQWIVDRRAARQAAGAQPSAPRASGQ